MQTATPTAVQDIVDSAEERELLIVSKEHERPPYFHAGKGGDTRLARAIRLCLDDKITPQRDGSYTVEGSEHRTYRCAESCSCPQSQKGKSKWCYHMCAVALYVEWQRRLRPVAPVELGTLRAGTLPLASHPDDDDALGNGYPIDDATLPLPPVTVDERLAQPAVQPWMVADAPPRPQEDRMTDDAYIPEPEAAVAVLERPVARATRSHEAQALADSMTAWREQRQLVTQYIKEQLVENVDYYSLRIKGRDTKPTLSKAGAEKFLAILRLSAAFANDEPTWRMLGAKEGTLCYVCTLTTRDGQVVGEGRGARSISQDGGDINKAIKMSEKSALIDAVLRTGCLSDCFTQDLDEAPETQAASPTRATPASQELRQRIWTRVQVLAPEVRTREAVEAWVSQETGFALHPDYYRDILATLEAR